MIKRTPILLAAGVAATAVVLTGCGGSSPPSAAACRSAMSAQLTSAEAHPGTGASMGDPASCKGLPAATLQKIAAQLVEQGLQRTFQTGGA